MKHRPTSLPLLIAGAAALAAATAHADIVVQNQVRGTTPAAVGYNLSYFRSGSNTSDWWRYSGVKAARAFIRVTDLEPSDDISGTGDGIKTKADFLNRQSLLRANSANPAVALSNTYVKWTYFKPKVDAAGEFFTISYTFPALQALGAEVVATISATESRFPLANNTEYAKMWELWQHYYAVSFILSRDYGVRRYTMYNEPNLADSLTLTEWLLRYRVVSDAIKAGIADMNARYGKSLVPQVMAPNTGTSEYNDAPGDDWGRQTVLNRHTDMWGVVDPNRKNVDIYNYQKYAVSPDQSDSGAGYIEDCLPLKSNIAADMPGETPLPIALTEMNSRTGSNYSTRTDNADTPFDFAALGASAIALTTVCQAEQLYLFKFGMATAPTSYNWDSKLSKNGTHYVNSSTSGVNNYGGAAGTAEVWRLFAKAAGQRRNSLDVVSDQPYDVWTMVTREAGVTYVYMANRTTVASNVAVDVAALGIPDGSLVTLEEVSSNARGNVIATPALSGGRIVAGAIPGTSVWLLSIYEGSATAPTVIAASDDAQLRDGSSKSTKYPNTLTLTARADGTANNRYVSLLKFPVSATTLAGKRVLLQLSASQSAVNATPAQVHVYGLNHDTWSQASTTWSNIGSTVLRQSVGTGDTIAYNVTVGPGVKSLIQGQLMANTTTATVKAIDVTDFVKSQTDGTVSFMLVQDHRWDYPNNASSGASATGDTQSTGIVFSSRLGTAPPALLVY